MNLANKLTMLRVVMIPAFVIVLYADFEGCRYVALALFAIASFTDFLDGYIARSRNLVTDFGKFMDPLADKVLVMTAMLMFVSWGQMPAWVLAVVLARELDMDFQLEVMAGHSGTNGWPLQVSREGVATAVLSLPLRYMHTPVETVNCRDLEATAELLAAFIRGIGREVPSYA